VTSHPAPRVGQGIRGWLRNEPSATVSTIRCSARSGPRLAFAQSASVFPTACAVAIYRATGNLRAVQSFSATVRSRIRCAISASTWKMRLPLPEHRDLKPSAPSQRQGAELRRLGHSRCQGRPQPVANHRSGRSLIEVAIAAVAARLPGDGASCQLRSTSARLRAPRTLSRSCRDKIPRTRLVLTSTMGIRPMPLSTIKSATSPIGEVG